MPQSKYCLEIHKTKPYHPKKNLFTLLHYSSTCIIINLASMDSLISSSPTLWMSSVFTTNTNWYYSFVLLLCRIIHVGFGKFPSHLSPVSIIISTMIKKRLNTWCGRISLTIQGEILLWSPTVATYRSKHRWLHWPTYSNSWVRTMEGSYILVLLAKVLACVAFLTPSIIFIMSITSI